jgi:hypothetical protein
MVGKDDDPAFHAISTDEVRALKFAVKPGVNPLTLLTPVKFRIAGSMVIIREIEPTLVKFVTFKGTVIASPGLAVIVGSVAVALVANDIDPKNNIINVIKVNVFLISIRIKVLQYGLNSFGYIFSFSFFRSKVK